MLHSFVNFLSGLVQSPGIYGALGLFAVSAVDEFVAFIPSSLILTAEILFLKDPLSLVGVSRLTIFVGLPIALGTTLGALPLYGAGYAGGKPALDALSHKWKMTWADVEKWGSRFGGTWQDELLFFFLRATPLVPTLPVTAAAGVVRMRPEKFVLITILGIMVRVVITLVILRTGGQAVLSHAIRL